MSKGAHHVVKQSAAAKPGHFSSLYRVAIFICLAT